MPVGKCPLRLPYWHRVCPPATTSLLLVEFQPAPELGFFIGVRVQTRDPLPDGADVVQDLQVEVSRCLRPADLPLGSDPGEIAMGPGAADLLAGIPDPFEAALIQGTKWSNAFFVEAAGGAAFHTGLLRPTSDSVSYGPEKIFIHRRNGFSFVLP